MKTRHSEGRTAFTVFQEYIVEKENILGLPEAVKGLGRVMMRQQLLPGGPVIAMQVHNPLLSS